MKNFEIPLELGSTFSIELRPSYGEFFPSTIQAQDPAQVADEPGRGEILRTRDKEFTIVGFDDRARTLLADLTRRRISRRCWISDIDGEPSRCRSLCLRVHEFIHRRSLDSALPIEIGNELCDRIREVLKVRLDEELTKSLSDEFLLEPEFDGADPSMLVTAGRVNSVGNLDAFRIHGKRFNLDVARRKALVEGKSVEILVATRITARRPQQRGKRETSNLPCTLITGKVDWSDSSSSALSGLIKTQLDAIVHGSSSYLGLWESYNEIERAAIKERAKEFGAIPYRNWREVSSGEFEFDCGRLDQPQVDRFKTCFEAKASLEALDRDISDDSRRPGKVFVGEPIMTPREGWVRLRARNQETLEPPKSGVLRISVLGDELRLDRRKLARDMISSGKCQMPWIGLILEGKSISARAPSSHKPFTPDAKKPFRGSPTPAQEFALRTALNTPDIAIIQGPPGTGKTRVIAALQTRLAEIGEGTNGPFKQTLLTSYQHDAVDNLSTACTAFGLPSLRVGSRAGERLESSALEYWRGGQIERLRATTASSSIVPVQVARRNVRRKVLASFSAPSSLASELNLLNDILAESEQWIPPELFREANALVSRLRSPAQSPGIAPERQLALQTIRGLPSTTPAALDDGPKRAAKALRVLEALALDVLRPEEKAMLEALQKWGRDGDMPHAELWPELKSNLIERLTPAVERGSKPLRNDDIEGMLLKIRNALDDAAAREPFSASVAIEELIEELESDPSGVAAELERYVLSVAATVQQAVGKEMISMKSRGESFATKDWQPFETVIVDEAARCNPLDLMIPMSIAQRRVVLVGDHRQLPHILEPGVERELKQSCSEETKEALGKSLFERLVVHVRKLEETDGIPRYVRLDKQYRMAQSLGKFVSDAFYAPYGEGFESGRLESELQHDLGGIYEGKRGVWVEASSKEGSEQGRASKQRAAEVERIGAMVKELFQDRPDLSVGVITFYADQVDALEKELARQSILEEISPNRFVPQSNWRSTLASKDRSSRDRIRVGTVDAFQGLEFDVVFLSLVRSNAVPLTSEQKSWTAKFGFLLVENRVCVAMSRQERLLFVVGDSKMFTPEDRAEQPGLRQLRDFYLNFCEGAYGLRV